MERNLTTNITQTQWSKVHSQINTADVQDLRSVDNAYIKKISAKCKKILKLVQKCSGKIMAWANFSLEYVHFSVENLSPHHNFGNYTVNSAWFFSLFAVNSAWFLLCSLDCLVAGFLFCGGRLFCAHIPVGFLWLHMHTNTFPPSVSKSFMEKSAAENKTYWNNGTSLTIQSISELLNLLCPLSVCMLIKSGYFYCFLCGGCVFFFRGCQGCVYLGWVCESTHDVITF